MSKNATGSMNSPAVVSDVAAVIAKTVGDDPDAHRDVAEEIVNIVRAEIADELNTLADLRREYGGPDTPFEDIIAREVQTARTLTKIVGRVNDAFGWLPSWTLGKYMKKHNPRADEVWS